MKKRKQRKIVRFGYSIGKDPVRKILLDTKVECLCVDETDSALYCVMATSDYCIGKVSVVGDSADSIEGK